MIDKTLNKFKVKVIMAIKINSYDTKQCMFLDDDRFGLPRISNVF